MATTASAAGAQAGRPLPGPTGLVLGRRFYSFWRDPLDFLTRLAREHGDVAGARLGPRTLILVSHPELIRELLVTRDREFMKSPALQRAKQLLGEGLLTSEGELHLRQRRLIQPIFHRERVAAYGGAMGPMAAAFAERRWRDGAVVDVAAEMMQLTLSVVARTLFGADLAEEAPEIGRALTDAMSLMRRASNPLAPLLDRLPLPATRRFRRARARLDETIYRLLRQRRARGLHAGDDDLLGLLLGSRASGQAASAGRGELQLRDEALTLFLAGHETTANALSWTLLLLALDPPAAQRVRAEARARLGERAAGPEDYEALPFTLRVLTESMRLYPPAWVVARQALHPLELGGFAIPARQPILASQWVVHRDARWYEEPERFDPDRWLPERAAALPRFAYFPFGGGARKCIGEGFAWMEAVLVLATLAARWEFRLVPGQTITPLPLVTLRARPGILMEVRRVRD
ncbi:MAG TPA: cytochrome P450 [Longimicrobiales bacterium]